MISPNSELPLNRRAFIAAAAAVAATAACATCGFAESGRERNHKPRHATGGKVDVGAINEYSTDGITEKFIKPNSFAVIRHDKRIYASSAICTHQFTTLVVNGKQMICNRHGSAFSIEGTVTKGPANDSLERYAISKDANAHLIVNTDQSFREKDWDKPDAFVEIA